MRHQHAGLAIPDFPLAYGKIWPDTSADAVARYNADRDSRSLPKIPSPPFRSNCKWRTASWRWPFSFGVAAVRVAGVAAARRKRTRWRRLAVFWLALIVAQIALGAATIWTNKAADVATAHVLVGALSLVTGALWCADRLSHRPEPLSRVEPVDTISSAFGAQPALAGKQMK